MTNIKLPALSESKYLESTFVKAAIKDEADNELWRVIAPLALTSVALAAFLKPADPDVNYENQVRGILSELIVFNMLPTDFGVCIDEDEEGWDNVSPHIVLGIIVEKWRDPDLYVDNLIALFSLFKSYMLYIAEKIVQPNLHLLDNADCDKDDIRLLMNLASVLKIQTEQMGIYGPRIEAIRDGGSGARN